jgi:beta-lactamase class A
MDRTQHLTFALTITSRAIAGTFSLVAGLGIVYPSQVVAPPSPYSMAVSPDPEIAHLLPARTLAELNQVRDRLRTKTKHFPYGLALLLGDTAQNQGRWKTLQAVNARIQLEETAENNWEKAQRLALQAEKKGRLLQLAATRQQAKTLWQQALKSLQVIPPDSLLAGLKTKKISEYEAHLATATHEAKLAESAFLVAIAQRSNLSAQAMITVCHSSAVCHHLRGNQPPDNPASLAKVPIVVALLQKTNAEKINLNTPIYVKPGNFTEDASEIQVGQRYPLRTIVMQTIDHSSNIGANQVIDYLGYDYINQVLQNRGYQITRVNHKFMGEATMPSNPGRSNNRLTSNELTKMMVQIYNREYPGDTVLMQALKQQKDRSLGITALQGSAAQWLGEKTGQNSKVLGTTLALKISSERYFITVIDHSGNALNIRRCITQIASYLHQNH